MGKSKSTFFFRFELLALSFFLSCVSVQAKRLSQIQSLNFDFDDNIFVTGAQVEVWDVVERKKVGLSTADWALMRLQFIPQGYTLLADSFRLFGDGTQEGTSLFRRQIESALKSGRWKGPSWDAFVWALSSPDVRDQTTIITARKHASESILEGLKSLRHAQDKAGNVLLPALPEKENIFAVLSPDLPEKFKAPSAAEGKAKVMSYLLDQVEEIPLPRDAGLIDSREGDGGKAALHLWAFSDDDYNITFSRPIRRSLRK